MPILSMVAISVVLLFGWPATLLAQSYEEGKKAYLLGDYAKAQQQWHSLAENGDVNAQFGLGTLYAAGNGVDKDHTRANFWFEKAATQGFPPAQFNLGNAYRHGRGVAQDEARAVAWWSLAAQQNFAPAQYNLATAYYFGRGVVQSEELAIQWYEQAAANQYEPAIQQLELIRKLVSGPNDASGPAPSARKPDKTQATMAVQEAKPLQDAAGRGGRDASVQGSEKVLESGVSISPELLCTDNQWIRLQSPEHYTIQLMGAHGGQYVKDFMESYRHLPQLVCVQAERAGKRWYMVIYQSFPTRAAARAALVTLPHELQEQGAWIRAIGEVQDSIAP